ncbi:MAG TPA: head GIN domain-containing protein [Cyclobacteriaceae bacterium]|nr:head GIN domain-containing protein [Cyclobacteriaceae bacterium]HRJ82428.1 head GIN domain-containing protein [Cyclobacteriaceae bacterium]
MKYFISLLILIASLSVKAQKPNETIGSFSKIDVFGPFEVELIKADSESLALDYRGVDPEDIVAEVSRGELKLKLRNKHYMNEWKDDFPRSKYIRARVYYTELTDVRAQAGAEVFSTSTLKSRNLALDCSMGAEMQLDVISKNLYTKATMGAVIKLTGQAETFEAKANMGAELKASQLLSKVVYVNANMGAEVKVNALEEIEISAGFGATVDYTGSPNVRHTNRNFGAEVRSH